MALLICEDCTTTFAVGLESCPHCGGETFHEATGDDMPKNTRSAGATNAITNPPSGDVADEPVADTPQPAEDEPTEVEDPPAATALKEEWVAWAEQNGAPDDIVNGTKADIQEWADSL